MASACPVLPAAAASSAAQRSSCSCRMGGGASVVSLRAPAFAPPRPGRRNLKVRSQKKAGLGDGLLDMMQGGPKLRRWYGEDDLVGVGNSRAEEELKGGDEEKPEDDGTYGAVKDTVLVVDADTPTGEQVVLQLILAREKVRVLVADTVAAKNSYGDYVEAASGQVSALAGNRAVLKGVSTLIVPGRLGNSLKAAKEAGVPHVAVLSSVGLAPAGGPVARFLPGGAEAAELRDEAREAEVRGSGIPHTVVRVGNIKDVPGDQGALVVSKDGAPAGDISREDVGRVLSGCASTAAPSSSGAVVTVACSGGDGSWKSTLEEIIAA